MQHYLTLVYPLECAQAQNDVCACSTHVYTCFTGVCMPMVSDVCFTECIHQPHQPFLGCSVTWQSLANNIFLQ